MRGFQIKSYVGKKRKEREGEELKKILFASNLRKPPITINITSSKISRFSPKKKNEKRNEHRGGSEVKQTAKHIRSFLFRLQGSFVSFVTY